MKNARWLLAAFVCAAAAAPDPGSPRPAAAVGSVVRFEPPKGWSRSDYANSSGADPVVAFESGADVIRVAVYGAPGSAYRSPADFLAGPAATTMGRPAEPAGSATVAGVKTPLLRRGSAQPGGDPHAPAVAPPAMGQELFCVLPVRPDGRFAVLSWERRTPVPDLSARGEKAWRAFLIKARPAPVPKA